MTEKKSQWDTPKVRRKALYAGVVVVGVILAGVGLIEPDQIDATVQRIIDVGGPLLSLFGITAFRNVDAPAQEVEAERSKAREEALAEVEKVREDAWAEGQAYAQQVGDALVAKLDSLPEVIRGPVSEAVLSVYDQPYGKHDIEAATPEPEPENDPAGPGIYPGA
ncbi:Putative membrane protein [Corynebacterium glyciniphilum AJ 3170]|uniref:Putative membrane protein n=1 Tax=Corynebacterium glyciniphilum AJ 3170 TaxID=1404245 RepID=X5DWA8_9CORY|nr:hypothetical protein [Corynebacterium glyciniphilum]AHW64887.1 Putative membrane protein [Corynebacterium glyciniphilum AJ 3170]